jgi:hypothetical protein
MTRRLPVRRDPLRDRVVSVIALHLQLHRLSAPVRQRLRNEHPVAATVRAGPLDDKAWLVPVAHMFMRSAQPWALPAANAECRESGPKDFSSLMLGWPAIWPEFFPQNSSIFAEPFDGTAV